MTKISIVTAAYNADKHISHMIKSVMMQPIVVELIIINDGSTDLTESICSEYRLKYANIKVLESENKGAGNARNIGIEAASGEYVMFLDSDDLLLANSINENLCCYLDKTKADIICTARLKTDINLLHPPIVTLPEPVEDIRYDIPQLEFWTCIYRREFILQEDIRFFTYKEQDIESAFRYKAFSSAKKVINAPYYSFYLQRDNLESNMHTFNYCKLFYIKSKVYKALIADDIKRGIKENIEYLQLVMVECIWRYFDYVNRNGLENKIKDYELDELKQIFEESSKIITFKCFKFYKRKTITYFKQCLYLSRWCRNYISFKEKSSMNYNSSIKKENDIVQKFDCDDDIIKRLEVISNNIDRVSLK